MTRAPHPGGNRLGQRFYVIIAEPTEQAGARSIATDAHLAFLAELEAEGTLFLAGPFVGEDGASSGGGLFIVRCQSRVEAEAVAARDPYNAGGYRRARVMPWRLDQGSFDLGISLTLGRARFR